MNRKLNIKALNIMTGSSIADYLIMINENDPQSVIENAIQELKAKREKSINVIERVQITESLQKISKARKRLFRFFEIN